MTDRDTPKGAVIGIDLGTTFSLVATMVGDVPTVLTNAIGEKLTASAVSIAEDGTILVGGAARARATTFPGRTALAFKRDIGTPKVFDLEAQKLTPQELSALVLKTLREDAEKALGMPVVEAVVTVPAYFGERQREATRAAAAIAGLKVERIINEPTAAALAYGLHERKRELKAVVLDLGGGTFDVTVLEIMEGVIEIQSSAGDARLGGEDFTAALGERCAAYLLAHHGHDVRQNQRGWARVLEACEDAKKRLSVHETTEVPLPHLPLAANHTVDVTWTLSRDVAEEAWAPLLQRMRAPITRALRDASVGPDKIAEVLLVGGATRMPGVVRLATSMFGRMPNRSLPPDEAIALGAAVQAALQRGDASVEDVVATDVAPFSMGLETSVEVGADHIAGVFSPVLERGTVIPASRVERYSTVHHFQEEIRIRVFQGEHSLCADNTFIGEYMIRDLPSAPAGATSIDVRFTYDLNGLLEVETTIVGTDKKQVLVVEQSPGRLSAHEIAEAQARMERLKFHPREALPNTTALERADALYMELSGAARQDLGMAIGAFRVALDAQDKPAIELGRQRLYLQIARYKQ